MSVGLLHVFYFPAIKLEREYEMKRLNHLKCQENVAEEIQFSLRERPVGLRRPLPPKWSSSHTGICTLCFPHPKAVKVSSLSLSQVGLGRPFWPKWSSSHNQICTLCFSYLKATKVSNLSLQPFAVHILVQTYECLLVDELAPVGWWNSSDGSSGSLPHISSFVLQVMTL